jgi:hypothetical protein
MKLKTSIVSLVVTAGLLAMAAPANASTVAKVAPEQDVNMWMSDSDCDALFCLYCAVAAIAVCTLVGGDPDDYKCQPAAGTEQPCICSFTCAVGSVDRVFVTPTAA